MPGRDLLGSMDICPSPNFTMFKAHKTFPRRNNQTSGRRLSQSLGFEQRKVREEDQESYKSSQKIRSWIPEPSPTHAAPDHDLPLTPPINMTDHEDERWIEDKILANGTIAASRKDSSENGMTTPVIQHSPPTPEITPPRVHDGIRALAPVSSREPSLRADSFETARENISSEDESPETDSPSLHPARQRWLHSSGRTKLKDIGLGLGLESEDEDPTPTEMTPKQSLKKYNFDISHATWSERRDVVGGFGIMEGDHGLSHVDFQRNSQRDKFQPRQRFPTQPVPRSPKTGEDATSSLARSSSLRQRVEKSQQTISASTERFAEEIDWPMKEVDIDIDARLREVDNRRFSQISATSTVVEAMVIDKPPQRRQTLRHTGKISAMTFENPQGNQSNRSSMISTSSTRRRLPRHAITPSIATDASGSRNSSQAKMGQEIVPVIVIPRRRSSLKSSGSAGRNISGTTSLTFPRQQPSRPTTAPEEATGYFDLPHRERRIVSAVLPLTKSSKSERRVVETTQPVLRVSTPEPVSDEIPKIISVPSANIVSPQAQPGQPAQPQPVLHLSEPTEIRGTALDRSTAGDWSALRPRSALVTPFSVRSTHSSTPGTLEVNEATAISIYPHTNKSILVIQQMSRGDSNDPTGRSAIIAGNANIALPGSITPAMIHQSRQPLNSPLKNPRDPPRPPDFKIIPPTPANAPTTDEADSRNPPSSPAKTRLSRPISLVKRALSARRYSESFVSPLTRSFSRRNTINTRRPSVGDDPAGKLHPFWRPRGFWDDLSDSSSDSDSEFGNSGLLVGDSVDAQLPRKNSIAQSPSRRGLGRSASLTKRFTESFNLKSSNSNSHPTRTHTRSGSEGHQHTAPLKLKLKQSFASFDNDRSYEFLPQPEHKRGSGMMPRLGYRVQFVGFKGLAERMEKAKVRREEGRRERVRERLRGSIGVVRLGDGGLISGGMNDMRR